MSTSPQLQEPAAFAAISGMNVEHWYAVQTRPRREKAVVHHLCDRGVTTFFPTVTEVHRWSDRMKAVEVPLFSCYLFVKTSVTNEDRQRVLRVDNVLGFVGTSGLGTPIPDEQVDAVRTLVSEKLPYSCHPFLIAGERVRIRSGALAGLEGILLSRKGDRRLVISVDAMQRSLSIQIDGYDVEAT
jgi:transcription antitermination factor NusG